MTDNTNQSLELAVIGAALAHDDQVDQLREVDPSWFVEPAHAAIWAIVQRLQVVAVVAVIDELNKAGRVGDVATVHHAVDAAPASASQIRWHVDKLREQHHRRVILQLGKRLVEGANDGDLSTMIDATKAQLSELKHKGNQGVYYSVRGWGEIAAMELKPRGWFWGETFALGQIQSVIGQGGLGKSRISLNLVRNQVLGLPFAGMMTGDRPLVHLMMGSENSIHRLQYDIRKMSTGLTPEQIELLSQHIHLATIEHAEDGYISLESDANVERWRATIERFKPDVLWVDPYGDIHAGDGNSDSDTRFTISTLSRLARRSNPDTGIVILHHSRTGAANIAQATGFDAANFGKGSKALYSSCRAVVNLAPFDETENPSIVCACGKNNNAKRFEPIKLTLDEHTMTYTHDLVDVDAWRDEVQSVARGKRGTNKATKPLEEYHSAVVAIVEQTGLMPYGKLFERVKKDTGLGDKRIDRLLSDCVFSGVLAKTPRLKERDGKVLYGTPKQVAAIMNPKLKV